MSERAPSTPAVTYSIGDLIAHNRRNTRVLITLYLLFVVLVGFGLGSIWAEHWMGGATACTIGLVILLVSTFRGDRLVLSISGAHPIGHAEAPQLYNVVEEMSIAAGVPMPKVYIIDSDAPNALATGRDPEHASIAFTRGLLAKLNRDELQGVAAHELSHIRNHDTHLAVMMGILLGLVALAADGFLRSLRYRGRRRSWSGGGGRGGGSGVAVLVLLGILLAVVAPLFAKLLSLAVSRQREFLADASAADLTRLPEGLARALEKISRDPAVLDTANRATQHLYIVNPHLRLADVDTVFATHPPIGERIRRLRAMR